MKENENKLQFLIRLLKSKETNTRLKGVIC